MTVLVGISGSGKSTWAHEQWEKDPLNVVVVNRDNIRQLLFGFNESNIKDYYKSDKLFSLEKEVTKYEDTIIHEALASGKDVIVDATHLRLDYIKRFSFWNVSTEIKTFFIEPSEAIRRDMKRTRQVGDTVIKKQYQDFIRLLDHEEILDFKPSTIKNNRNLPPCIIFDIDGTLALMQGRSPFDWKRVGEDLVDYPTSEICSYINELEEKARPHIVICTGRDGIAAYSTKKWLEENGILYDEFHIRKEKDSRPDWVVKEEMWRDLADRYNIVGLFDDRLQVVRRARSLGLKVFHVEYNNV